MESTETNQSSPPRHSLIFFGFYMNHPHPPKFERIISFPAFLSMVTVVPPQKNLLPLPISPSLSSSHPTTGSKAKLEKQLNFDSPIQFFKVDSTSLEKNWVWKSNRLVLRQRVQFVTPTEGPEPFLEFHSTFPVAPDDILATRPRVNGGGGKRRVSGDAGSFFFFSGESFLKTRKGTPQVVGANITKG